MWYPFWPHKITKKKKKKIQYAASMKEDSL